MTFFFKMANFGNFDSFFEVLELDLDHSFMITF